MTADRSQMRAIGGGLLLFAIVAAASLAYSSIGGGGNERLVMLMLINMVLVLSLQIFIGNTGVLSFGHLVFPAVAGYTTGILVMPAVIKSATVPDAPFGLADAEVAVGLGVLAGIGFALVVAAIFGVAMSRLSELAAAIFSLALLFVVHQVLTNWRELSGGAEGLFGLPVKTDLPIALGAVLLSILVARIYKESRAGLAAQAARDDELAAAAIGINVGRTRYEAWLLSGGIGALGGIMLALYLGSITPDEFYLGLMFTTIAFLIVGGMGSVSGAVVGTMAMTAVLEVARRLADGPTVAGVDLPEIIGLSEICLGGAIIAVMTWRPAGLFGDAELDDRLPTIGRKDARQAPSRVATSTVAHPGHAKQSGEVSPLLEVEGITKRFVGLVALSQVSLRAGRGEIVGVIGPNGAGKTTLLNIISGNLEPDAGRTLLDGDVVTGLEPMNIARVGISRTFQNLRLFESLNVRDNVAAAVQVASRHRSHGDLPVVSDLLREFRLEALAAQPAGALPQGDRRRLEMARAVGLAPAVLLLDEPTAGMNDLEARDLLERIELARARLDCAVVVVDHNVGFIMGLCSRVFVLKSGELIASGTPDEIQRHPEVIEAYLGTPRGSAASARARPAADVWP